MDQLRHPPSRRSGTSARATPRVPAGLQSAELEINGVSYRVLSHPIQAEPSRDADALTAAERDIAARLMAGASQADIACARGTSPRTVAKQIEVLYRKLGIGSRAELMTHLLGR